MGTRGAIAGAAAALLISTWAADARAEDAPAPLALTLMLKVITYDAQFASHGSGDFLVLVPVDGGDADAALEVAQQLDAKAILGRKLVFERVPLAELEKRVKERKAAAVLAPQGTSSATAQQMARIAQAAHIYTLTLTSRLVDDGLVLGVDLDASKPRPVINIAAARAAGVDFKPTVLKIARTVQ